MVKVIIRWDTLYPEVISVVEADFQGKAPLRCSVEGPFCCKDMAEYQICQRQTICGCKYPITTENVVMC